MVTSEKTKSVDDRWKLNQVKEDLFFILSLAPSRSYFLKQTINQGQLHIVNLSQLNSTSKDYCCVKSTFARIIRGALTIESPVEYARFEKVLYEYYSSVDRFCRHICPGDTPATNPHCQMLIEWIDEFIAAFRKGPRAKSKSLFGPLIRKPVRKTERKGESVYLAVRGQNIRRELKVGPGGQHVEGRVFSSPKNK